MRWDRLARAAVLLARAALLALGVLLVWSVAPTAFGLRADAMLPGAMVPYVALPAAWWSARDFPALASAATGLVGLILVAASGGRRPGERRGGRHRRHYRGRRRSGTPPTAARLAVAAAATATVIGGAVVWHASHAAPSSSTAGGW